MHGIPDATDRGTFQLEFFAERVQHVARLINVLDRCHRLAKLLSSFLPELKKFKKYLIGHCGLAPTFNSVWLSV